MGAERRGFDEPEDFEAISRFLYGLYDPGRPSRNWLQPVWEYGYTHAEFDQRSPMPNNSWSAPTATAIPTSTSSRTTPIKR